MSNKVLSFLGTGNYTPICHSFNDKSTDTPHKFIQEAILELFCGDWNENDSIIIFLTEKARSQNWNDRKDEKTNEIIAGLKNELDKLKEDKKCNISIKDIDIKDGKDDDELWEIFNIIINNIDESDNIIFDITHAFRSIPMLSLIILNYAKFIKKIKIDKIVYAAFEAKIDDKTAPIFDLTPFVRLFDWTVAIDRFLDTGDAKRINELGTSELIPKIAETKGKEGIDISKFIKKLDEFTKAISTCRGPEIKGLIDNIKKLTPDAKKESGELLPLQPLFEKIEQKFDKMSSDDHIQSGLSAVEWCHDNGLIQQGFTILRENFVNYVMMKILIKGDLRKKEDREEAEYLLNTRDIRICEEMLEIWRNMIDFRNSLNHAGWRKCNPQDFDTALGKYIERAKAILI
jgi:CRISPR-associated Csx2 family protein